MGYPIRPALADLPSNATLEDLINRSNEHSRMLNALRLRQGPGVSLQSSDDGLMVSLGKVTGTLECSEGGGGTITIKGE